MSFLDEEFNDPYYPKRKDPIRILWGQFAEGADYDADYASPYSAPASAFEEDVWVDEYDPTKTEKRSVPYKFKTKVSNPSQDEPKESTNVDMNPVRTQHADISKFVTSFKQITIAPPSKRWYELVKEAPPQVVAEAIEVDPTASTSIAPTESSLIKYATSSWANSNISFGELPPAETESQDKSEASIQSGSRAPQRSDVDALIEKAMQNNILGGIPKISSLDAPRKLVVKIGNPRVTNTIQLQAVLRKVGALISTAMRTENFQTPPKLLLPPSPMQNYEMDGFRVLQDPDEPILVKNSSEMQQRRKFTKSAVEKMLRRSLYLLLAQIGFRVIKKKAMRLLLDTAMLTLERLAKDIARRRGTRSTRREWIEDFLRDHNTNIEEINDYYIKHTVRYEEKLYEKYVKYHELYLDMLQAKKQKEEAARLAEMVLRPEDIPEMIPELHVPDRPEGYDGVPDLASGMQILQTLEQEAAALQLEDPMNPSAGIPLPMLEISESLSVLSNIPNLPGPSHLYTTSGGSATSIYTGYHSTSMFDIPETPGSSYLCAGYPTSESGLPDFVISPATSSATVTSSSPGTPAPIGPNKRRRL